MPVRKWVAVVALSAAVSGPLHAQAQMQVQAPPEFERTAPPRVLREAIARQRQPLLAAPAKAQSRTMQTARRRNSTVSKVTAAAALGFVGFWVGVAAAGTLAYATRATGDGKTWFYTGGLIGAGTGAGLGVWLASR